MKRLLLVLLVIPFIFILGCVGTTYTSISAAEGKAMLEADSSIILVDVRTQSEYDAVHIPGAIVLPVDDIATRADNIIPYVNATYIIYCNSGNRSAQASSLLVELGYKHIYDMGGIIDWPYETE